MLFLYGLNFSVKLDNYKNLKFQNTVDGQLRGVEVEEISHM